MDILSKAGEVCRLEYKPGMKVTINGKKVAFKMLPDGKIEFGTVKGGRYRVAY